MIAALAWILTGYAILCAWRTRKQHNPYPRADLLMRQYRCALASETGMRYAAQGQLYSGARRS